MLISAVAMPARLPDFRLNIIHHLLYEESLPIAQVAKRAQVCRTTLHRLRLSWHLYGTAYPPQTVKQGRPRALNFLEEQVRE